MFNFNVHSTDIITWAKRLTKIAEISRNLIDYRHSLKVFVKTFRICITLATTGPSTQQVDILAHRLSSSSLTKAMLQALQRRSSWEMRSMEKRSTLSKMSRPRPRLIFQPLSKRMKRS